MAYDPGLADRVGSLLLRMTTFTEKKMFGGVAYMVNGKMCSGVVKSDLVLRLGSEGAEAALTQRHTRPMDFTGKPMKSMIYVEPVGTDSEADLERWLRLAVDFAQQAPVSPKRRR
ncbi:MAG TPA: TfoX/Sxy family protein [Bryobacteraceae bacterium]|jgi:TfoX/Sxy family transcriptional regulator of competence genes